MTNYAKIIIGSIALIAAACSGGNMESDLQTAEMAAARGDMDAASSVARHLTSDRNLSGLTAKQLARLSIVYMQIADIDTTDNSNVATAASLYQKAYESNRDSAETFYSSLPSEKVQYSMILSSIVGTREHPYNADADMHADSLAADSLAAEFHHHNEF